MNGCLYQFFYWEERTDNMGPNKRKDMQGYTIKNPSIIGPDLREFGSFLHRGEGSLDHDSYGVHAGDPSTYP